MYVRTPKEYTYKKENLFLSFLCIILFFVSFITKDSSFENAIIISFAEIAILFLYVLTLREFPPFKNIIKNHLQIFIVLVIWFLCVTCSLMNSPTNLTDEPEVIERYFQTITHIVTFIFLWDFFNRYTVSLRVLFYLIPISTTLVACYFLIVYFFLSGNIDTKFLSELWFNSPPLNAHIRHTGYQAVAALSIVLVYFAQKNELTAQTAANILLLIFLWAFIFWLGGRGAILSIFVTALLIVLVLYMRKLNIQYFISVIFGSVLIGFLIAEWLSVFSWNGILSSIQRSVEASSINSLSSDRLKVWETSWESVKNHLVVGLGPQGYYFMPNRIVGVQPHNIFLQFLIEWGLIGTLLFLFLLVKGFWTGVKMHILEKGKAFNPTKLMAGAIITTLTIHSFIDGTYYHPQPSLYLAIAFAVWISPLNTRIPR